MTMSKLNKGGISGSGSGSGSGLAVGSGDFVLNRSRAFDLGLFENPDLFPCLDLKVLDLPDRDALEGFLICS